MASCKFQQAARPLRASRIALHPPVEDEFAYSPSIRVGVHQCGLTPTQFDDQPTRPSNSIANPQENSGEEAILEKRKKKVTIANIFSAQDAYNAKDRVCSFRTDLLSHTVETGIIPRNRLPVGDENARTIRAESKRTHEPHSRGKLKSDTQFR
jgi:hypothetical protein